MPDADTSPGVAHQARQRRRETALQRQGLALRFTLIIGDGRLAGAVRVACHQDTVTAEFPGVSVRVNLSGPLSGKHGGVVLNCRASYRSTASGPRETTREWRRVLTGRPGAPHQREALLREILAAARFRP
ncbi:hypothetical protein [Streptomyces albus]|uniref:hypothetical protein n=1 Tax=Streptomyces albus TaxID=1888 RepID=UPI0004CBECC4|nr:hypothetical protein [Streptomyces albus]